MSTPSLTRPLRLHRPWIARVATDAPAAVARWWRLRAERERLHREMEAAADLNEALLRDIGAPAWLMLDAQRRREARAFERELLHLRERPEISRYY